MNFAKSVIDKDTILIFDEFIINKNWEQDEYRALEEFCAINNYEYKVIGISFFTKQVALKLIGIQWGMLANLNKSSYILLMVS